MNEEQIALLKESTEVMINALGNALASVQKEEDKQNYLNKISLAIQTRDALNKFKQQ